LPKLKIIVVDRTRSAFLKEGEEFYLNRLRRYAQAQWVEVRPAKAQKGRSTEAVLTSEGAAILKRILPGDLVIALDRRGKTVDSRGLAAWITEWSMDNARVTFVIGGPFGLARSVRDAAHHVLSLSKLTFTHEMTRMVLLEQLYRAFTITGGEQYHK
jgi:23S rRNA (pseudouridine1915-N3)-methyltransferase